MKLDRAAVEAELKRLYKKHGALTTAVVLSAAADPKNPMYGAFDWDDREAAHSWRLEQARSLIKTFYITIEYEPNATVVVPRYVSEEDHQGDGRHYVDIVKVLNDDERRHELVVTTINRAASILRNCPESTCQHLADYLAAELAKL